MLLLSDLELAFLILLVMACLMGMWCYDRYYIPDHERDDHD